ncbi:MAG: c-type cytochrome [Burkholderiales bacterium]|nr:c-type cytochrome [Burkholderiales bacterium]MDE2434064.1 c-type cytochrome [Burkholderiales bacterium]
MKRIALLCLLMAAGWTAQAATPEEAMTKAGCIACHAKDHKIVGPAFKDIAAKYKGDKTAPAKLAAKVRAGGSGVWGPIPMPAHGPDKITDDDLKAVIESILKT